MVNQGDYLSRLLHQGDLGWSVMLLGMLAAFAFIVPVLGETSTFWSLRNWK